MATALLGGSGLGFGLDDVTDDMARDPERRALAARITVGGDPACDAIYPAQFPAVLTVHTIDGRTLVEEVLVNRGGPGDPLSDTELERKFSDNTAGLLSPADASEVMGTAARLAALGSVAELMAPLRRVRR